MSEYYYSYDLDDILETFEQNTTPDAMRELSDDFSSLLDYTYQEETEKCIDGKKRHTTKPLWQVVFNKTDTNQLKILKQAIVYGNSHLDEQKSNLTPDMIEDANVVFQAYHQQYIKGFIEEDLSVYDAKKSIIVLLNYIDKVNELEEFKAEQRQIIKRQKNQFVVDQSDKRELCNQAWNELHATHAPLLQLFSKNDATILFYNASDQQDRNVYLSDSKTILLSCVDTAHLHQGLVSLADDLFHFSQTPLFQAIAKNFFNQSNRQMLLPFSKQVPFRLSDKDYNIARFVRRNILFVQNEFDTFAKELPGYFAYLSHQNEYTPSQTMENVLTLIDAYTQADIAKDRRRIVQLNYLLKDLKNINPVTMKKNLRNITTAASIILIKKHKAAKRNERTASREKED